MPDRSSRHGLPDDWNHGSHARPPHSTTGASNGYGAAQTEAVPARTDGYGAAKTNPFPSLPDAYGPGTADPFGDAGALGAEPFGAGKADPFSAAPAGTAGTYGAATAGTADPFGPATAGTADPFGAATAGTYGAATFGAGAGEAGTARPEAGPGTATIGAARGSLPGAAADAKGFLAALFDFSFASFVTPKVIRALYMLIVAGTMLGALVFTIMAFRASMTLGIVTLVFADPLFVLIVLAIYRVILEFFMVSFRVADDIRALRQRGDLR
jgi:Domain of unknown function (DUF4282)